MTLTETPICNFGERAKNFNLLSTENKKIEIVKDFLELQKVKKLFLTESFFNQNENTIDKELFIRVLKKMKLETAGWNGKFVVVYLPDWNRFNQKYSFVKFFHKKINLKTL